MEGTRKGGKSSFISRHEEPYSSRLSFYRGCFADYENCQNDEDQGRLEDICMCPLVAEENFSIRIASARSKFLVSSSLPGDRIENFTI